MLRPAPISFSVLFSVPFSAASTILMASYPKRLKSEPPTALAELSWHEWRASRVSDRGSQRAASEWGLLTVRAASEWGLLTASERGLLTVAFFVRQKKISDVHQSEAPISSCGREDRRVQRPVTHFMNARRRKTESGDGRCAAVFVLNRAWSASTALADSASASQATFSACAAALTMPANFVSPELARTRKTTRPLARLSRLTGMEL